jgi:hypothetical protein
MPLRKSDEQYLEELKALSAEPAAAALQVMKLPAPPAISEWLADLRLLVGVPFTNLAADERLLPRESIRFFYVDENWLDALQDGALSIGTQSSRDTRLQANMHAAIGRTTEIAVQQVRRRRRKKPLAEVVAPGGTATGFILRSALVAGWPGLEVRAFADTGGQQPIELLRLERLAPDVMLCIVSGQSGIPARIDLNEPSEGLQFGVVRRNLPLGLAIAPRWPGVTEPARTGKVVANDPNQWVPPVMRKKDGLDTRVLDVSKLRDNLKAKLVELGAMQQSDALAPGDVALQMVKSPEQQSFLAGQTMPLTRKPESPPVEMEPLAKMDAETIFRELFRS